MNWFKKAEKVNKSTSEALSQRISREMIASAEKATGKKPESIEYEKILNEVETMGQIIEDAFVEDVIAAIQEKDVKVAGL